MYSGVSAEGSGVIVEGSAPVVEEAAATPPAADSKVLETVSVLCLIMSLCDCKSVSLIVGCC